MVPNHNKCTVLHIYYSNCLFCMVHIMLQATNKSINVSMCHQSASLYILPASTNDYVRWDDGLNDLADLSG